MARALISGRAVLSNILLCEDWERIILEHTLHYAIAGKKRKRYLRDEMRTRYIFEENFVRMLGARIDGYGEGRGLRVFDEAHNRMNNRDWEKTDQKLMLRRLSLSRKRGWNDLIISQHAKNTDVAIRRIADTEVRVVDWSKILKVPIMHTSLLPGHLFLAQTFPVEESAVPGVQRLGKKQSSELFHLGWWRKIYDTFADYEFDDELDDGDPLILPLPMPRLRAVEGGRADEPEVVRALDRASAQLAGGPLDFDKPPDDE